MTLADLMDVIDGLAPEDKARVHREAVAAEREECAKIVEDVMIASDEERELAKHVARCVRRQPRTV